MAIARMVSLDPSRFEEEKEAEFQPALFRPGVGEIGAIRYHLSQPGIVRVYIRPKARRFLVVRNLVDWESREAGEHTVLWDGKDSRGNLLDPSRYFATIQAQPLRGTVHRHDLPLDEELHHENVMAIGHHRIHAHTVHEPENCHQLKVAILEPRWSEKVGGLCRVVSQVSEEARGYGRESGHSARYYVDYFLMQENKEAPGAVAVWEWDTRGIPNGKHVLSVAQCDHHDHMDSDSIIVEVQNPESPQPCKGLIG